LRFPIRFTGANRAMAVIGIVGSRCRVEIDEAQLHVRFAWAFRLHVPLADVVSAATDDGRVLGWGVHGWGGRWLVNGSSSGLVRVVFDPPARAHTAGIAVRVGVLRVSVDDPEGLVDAISSRGARAPGRRVGPPGPDA
jgi:hypothetical protein